MADTSTPKPGPTGQPSGIPSEILAQIKTAENDAHELVYLLYQHRSPGMQRIICRYLLGVNVRGMLPQIIQCMLTSQPPSLPIYTFLIRKASRSLSFQTELFLLLKAILGKAEESIASSCYFLCCDLFGIAKCAQNRNIFILHLNYKMWKLRHGSRLRSTRSRHGIWRTKSALVSRVRNPSFPGLILYFACAVASLIGSSIFKPVHDVYKIFSTKKNFKSLAMNKETTSVFKRSILFYDMLVAVSSRLRKQPVPLRQRSLETELAYLNISMAGPVMSPFVPGTCIVSIATEECLTLDSAENVPYLVVAEVVSRHTAFEADHFSRRFGARAFKARTLQSHLASVNELSDIGDINGIRENILEALELVLFERDCPNKAGGAYSNARATSAERKILKNIAEDVQEIKNGAIGNKMEDATEEQQMPESKDDDAPSSQDEGTSVLRSKSIWEATKERVRANSKYSKYAGWSLLSFIVKSGSVLRQEYLAYQILTEMKHVFEMENVECYVRNYQIYLISEAAGLIETITDASSIHKIKSTSKSLLQYFQTAFSDQESARKNFLQSLAGYSLASYILQIKDRHNGNILIDAFGHIIHVDFGFILGGHPGFYCVENAPFKFSSEYLDLVDVAEFKQLFHRGFCALRLYYTRIVRLVEIMEDGGFCIAGTTASLTMRFALDLGERELEEYCNTLVDRSISNMRTVVYDRFQYFSNGYY